MIELEVLGRVHVLHWHDDENRFNRASLDALNAALDQVERVEGPCALVTTGVRWIYGRMRSCAARTAAKSSDIPFSICPIRDPQSAIRNSLFNMSVRDRPWSVGLLPS